MEDDKKNIDESWKDAVQGEKSGKSDGRLFGAGGERMPQEENSPEVPEPAGASEETELPEANFTGYITSLAFQTMVFLGEVPNPVTNETEKNLPQAKFLIDTLLMLREKTKGNLLAQENEMLNAFIYELQMRFVDILQKEGKGE